MSNRTTAFDTWERSGVVASGFEWHDDEAVDEAWRIWCAAGRPEGVVLEAVAHERRGSFRIILIRP